MICECFYYEIIAVKKAGSVMKRVTEELYCKSRRNNGKFTKDKKSRELY